MLGISKKEFIRRYSTSLLEDNAALFAGAGLSIPAGFADWRKLLSEIAGDLRLDIEYEHDLIAVAQYEENRKGNRDSLNEAIIKQFDKEARITQNHKLIARLPLDTIWTTNYDQLIEKALRTANKKVDVKHSTQHLATRKSHCDAVVFKMHGDVENAHDAILTKDDYECYENEREGFTIQLLADLLSKRFLFLGFSFTDPNLEYTLNRLKRLLKPYKKTGGKEHYCILRKPQQSDYGKEPNRYETDLARFEHKVADITRYGIQTVAIDQYKEIEDLLAALHRTVSTRNILISGAAHDYSPLGQERIESLSEELGKVLIESGYDIVSGVGKGIGAAVMVGAHKALGRPDADRLGQRLKLFPFPYWHPVESERNSYYDENRKEMAAQAGISIFIAGNKLTDRGVTESPGVIAEFEEAVKNGHFIIPIGATGHAALSIHKKLCENPSAFNPGIRIDNELSILLDPSQKNQDFISAILSIINKIRSI